MILGIFYNWFCDFNDFMLLIAKALFYYTTITPACQGIFPQNSHSFTMHNAQCTIIMGVNPKGCGGTGFSRAETGKPPPESPAIAYFFVLRKRRQKNLSKAVRKPKALLLPFGGLSGRPPNPPSDARPQQLCIDTKKHSRRIAVSAFMPACRSLS